MAPSNVEATVFVLDIGQSEEEQINADSESFLAKAISCIVRILERKIFSRPDDVVALVLVGTQETSNNLAQNSEGFYENISIATSLDKPAWQLIRTLKDKIHPTNIKADWFDALMVAVDFMLTEVSGRKISTKQIVLLTDFSKDPDIDDDKLEMFIEGVNNENIVINMIGSDFEKPVVKSLVSGTGAIECHFDDAAEYLMYYKKKAVTPWSWNVDLAIGSEIKIPVSAYCRTRAHKSLKEWRRAYKDPKTEAISTEYAVEKITKHIKENDNTYVVNEFDIIEGYLYGQKVIPFSEFDKMTWNSGPKGLKVFGFAKNHTVRWSDLSGDGLSYVYARKNNENAQTALNALVTAMDELGLIAIARRVFNNGNAPYMYALFPVIEEEYRCLSMAQIFFKEDYRQMKFPPLNRTGTPEQIAAIDGLIDSMELTDFSMNEDEELFQIGTKPNPCVQFVYDCIAHRALNPNDPLPGPRPEVKALLEVPETVHSKSEVPLKKVREVFPLVLKEKPIPVRRVVAKKTDADANGDVKIAPDEVLAEVKTEPVSDTTFIGTLTPAEDLHQLVSQGEPFYLLSDQVIEVIEKLLFKTLRDESDKVLKLMEAFRNESVRTTPTIYNRWMESFKSLLLERSKMAFFEKIVKNKLSLITITENPDSNVSDNRANLFADLNSLNDKAVIDNFSAGDDLFGDDAF